MAPLNENGIKLAEITGRAMREIHFDYCISSPLIRARRTVEIILKDAEMIYLFSLMIVLKKSI